MHYSTIVIGDELLIGQVTDTNSGWIARHLTPFGWVPDGVQVVSDEADAITAAIDRAFAQSDVVLMTGGLGPTKDDITKATLCAYFGGEMRLDESVRENVDRIFARRGLTMNTLTAGQAMVPSSCRVLQNEVGTAPIMWFERDGKVLVSMPGVPHETQTMMERAVIPQLLRRFHSSDHLAFRNFVVVEVPESELALRLEDFERALPQGLHLAYLPNQGVVRLRLTGLANDGAWLEREMESQSARLVALLGDDLVATDDKPLAQIAGERLRERGLTLATAESCTGGNVAHEITLVAGSSDYFRGAVVAYANEVKRDVLGVDDDALMRYGAVSQPVVEQMVAGACRALHTDCAVATSGIAGPGGGTDEKPVGTVWIAVRCCDKTVSRCYRFAGGRSRVIDQATTRALIMLVKSLL
ncbi:MAG: CinA family nicotinamide mononucleotide deamidase-related protein [Muribaculaceae bacterium]|nr:CinA family nicotinamide mononucleotide deamidase-related protein [Muribaculaceae bacterium]